MREQKILEREAENLPMAGKSRWFGGFCVGILLGKYIKREIKRVYTYIYRRLFTNISVFTIKEKKICSNIFKLYYFIKFNIWTNMVWFSANYYPMVHEINLNID